MTYVVDTHTLVWYLEGGDRLGHLALDALNNQSNGLIVPSIVLAEVRYLSSSRRIRLDYEDVLEAVLDDPRIKVVVLDTEVINRIPVRLEMHDAIVCATAILQSEVLGEQVQVITIDRAIRESGTVVTLW